VSWPGWGQIKGHLHEEGSAPIALGERLRQLRKEAGWPRPSSATRSAPTPSASAATRPARSRRPWTPSCASPRPSTSPSTTCSSTTYPAPLHAAEHNLGDRLNALGELSGDDLASLLHMLDALVAKNRLKTLADGIG
jgi:hypothetical protein